jgi:hypothetical protein
MDPFQLALNDVDFQWTTHVDNVWKDPSADIPELQFAAREQFRQRIAKLTHAADPASPLGIPLVGSGGSGKTHLLSSVRHQAFAQGQYFVFVDMTDVRDFWETVLQGYLRSLDQRYQDDPQFVHLLKDLIVKLGASLTYEQLVTARPPALMNRCSELIRGLAQKHRTEAREHQDVLRALILIASDDFDIQERGYRWLQGVGVGEDESFRHDFSSPQKKPEQIVRGLSWLMSLDAPTVLALDQLDAIVAEHNLASAGAKPSDEADAEGKQRQLASLAIIQGIAGGLSALRDVTRRTLTVVSSLEETWQILHERSAVTMRDRFEPPLLLKPFRDAESIRELVEKRLGRVYQAAGLQPPYASFPFAPGFFKKRVGQSPREVLKACNEHRQECALVGRAVEIGASGSGLIPVPVAHEPIRAEFEKLRRGYDIASLLDAEDEDALDKLIETACDALVEENPLPPNCDAIVDKDFLGSGAFEPLHARLRVVDRSANDRERHYAFRFLEKTHHIAFQSRLKAAMTAAGIAQDLGFRRLAVVRTSPLPKGTLSEKLIAELRERGGVVVGPGKEELQALGALQAMLGKEGRDAALTRQWLKADRIVSQLPAFKDVVDFLFQPRAPAVATVSKDNRENATEATTPRTASPPAGVKPLATPSGPANPEVPKSVANRLEIGVKLAGGAAAGAFSVALDNLTKHAVVLAGAGSGKTVLVRRIVEEASLAGVPAIVIDGANDLSRLGDPWPDVPENFSSDDRAKADRYVSSTEVIVWTPGRERGNPLRFNPLPDFADVTRDKDEFNAALDMARSSLEPIAIGGKVDKVRQGVLASALRFFALQGGGPLERLIAVLSDLPADANPGYDKAERIAREAADRLRAETETNPLFRGDGQSLDPAVLFKSRSNKVRVSVVNLSGLPDQGAQQQFMNQLAMTLFSWIKKHPARGRAIQGLLVIDEARDFVPALKTVAGKDNLIRLVAQARKYGLGLIFATQAPKSIDHNIIANCSTQFYGRQNSPAAIDTVREQLNQRGSSGADVAKLPRGVFYAYTEGLSAAVKIQTPLCLSHHPASPPDEEEVLRKADAAREFL